MPNHCYQVYYIEGPRKRIEFLYNAVKEQKFLSAVVPEPSDMFRGPLGDEEREMCEAEGRPNWYDWRNDNWNTKWDIYDAEITQEITDLPKESAKYNKKISYFQFSCCTAWAPPTPVWDKLSSTQSGLYVKLNVDYEDEGGMFAGCYKDGKDNCWQPEFEEEEAC